MINLFESYSIETETLYHSIKQSGHDFPTVVMDDDGFLPEGVTSPYQFFAKVKPLKSDRAKYFNEVEVPDLWEIIGSNSRAEIKEMNQSRGYIHYRENFKQRIVSHVEWLDGQNKIRSIDYYNQRGFKFATKVLDNSGKSIIKTYYDRQGKEVIYVNLITNDYVVSYKGKDYMFKGKTDFIKFYLREAFEQLDGFIINSLSTPLFVVYQLGVKGKDILFWQERIGESIPGNMQLLLENDSRDFTIAIPDRLEFDRVQSAIPYQHKRKVVRSGYLYRYMKKAVYGKNIVTLTNSDQLEHIEKFVTELPSYTFYIAAITEMSPKLMSLDKYSNVKLYPNVKQSTLVDIHKNGHIYLDINHGGEILNAVRGAFDYNLLVMGFKSLAHNPKFTSLDFLFNQNEPEKIIELLKSYETRKKTYLNHLDFQKAHVNEITGADFNKVFK